MAPNLPKKQWAQVFEKTGGKIEYKQIDVPTPGPDEVLVNVKYSGVCHTDLHAWKGDWPLDTKLPLVGGHEGAGYVVARGDLVTDEQAKMGEAVGLKWLNGSCLACEFCLVSDEQLCGKPCLSGYTVDGTFQQYAIGKAAHVSHIPDGVALDAVAPILCGGITVYRGLKESNAKPGQTVAIVGAGGGLGSLAIQYAKAMGLQVIAIDAGDDKKEMCKKMGVSAFVDYTKEDVVSATKKATPDGLGPHAVLLVAVSEKPFQQAAAYVRSHGTVVPVGLPAHANLSANIFDFVTRMVTIKGSYVGNRADSAEALEFFRRGGISAPFKVQPLETLPEVFEQMEAGKIIGRIVLKIPDPE